MEVSESLAFRRTVTYRLLHMYISVEAFLFVVIGSVGACSPTAEKTLCNAEASFSSP